MPRTNRPPKLCHHKATGQGYVLLNGRERYLGVYGTTATQAAYDRVIAEWLSSGRTAATAHATEGQTPAGGGFTVTELCVAFWEHAQTYYRNAAGEPTGELAPVKQALKKLRQNHGDITAAAFGPLALRAVRQLMIEAKWTRKNINRQVARVRAVFRWGVGQELVRESVLTALEAVEPLRRGRSEAKEAEPVDCVAMEHVEAVKPFLSRHVRAMVEVQLLTGMRPGEVCRLRMSDTTTVKNARGEEAWLYTLKEHKTAHHNQEVRTIAIGPKAIEIIRPFLKMNTEAYLFSPRDAEDERNAARRAARQTPLTPSQEARTPKRHTKPKGTKGERYTTNAYRVAVSRACDKANEATRDAAKKEGVEVEPEHLIPTWHPNQLRHNAITKVRGEENLESAAVFAGHKKITTTQEYAKDDKKRLVNLALKMG